jgi:sugar O-acyltransferase (sialic acid O-acetyltransferase NeuD family)
MSALLIVGAGGHGRVLAEAAMTMERWRMIAFLDDSPGLTRVLGHDVIGRCVELERLRGQFQDAAIGIGDARTRLSLLERSQQLGFHLPVIAHRSAVLSPSAAIGAGTVVFAQAAVNAGASIGAGCIINTGATVDHDCRLGAGVHVCPGVSLAGNVHIGERCWIGIGSCVKQGIAIADDVTVGAGAAVVSNVAAAQVVVGVPARTRR